LTPYDYYNEPCSNSKRGFVEKINITYEVETLKVHCIDKLTNPLHSMLYYPWQYARGVGQFEWTIIA